MARRSPATRDTEALDARTRILVLHGTEQMLKREAFDRLHHALNEQFGDIDPVILDSKTATLADVLDELRTRSLLQPHNLVIVDQAEQFVSAHRQALERYAQSPVDHATLVLRCDRWSRGKLDKLIGQMGALVKCQPPDRRQAAEWLIRRASKIHHCRLAPAPRLCRCGKPLPHPRRLSKQRLLGAAGPALTPSKWPSHAAIFADIIAGTIGSLPKSH